MFESRQQHLLSSSRQPQLTSSSAGGNISILRYVKPREAPKSAQKLQQASYQVPHGGMQRPAPCWYTYKGPGNLDYMVCLFIRKEVVIHEGTGVPAHWLNPASKAWQQAITFHQAWQLLKSASITSNIKHTKAFYPSAGTCHPPILFLKGHLQH